jgi:hypothetical protein
VVSIRILCLLIIAVDVATVLKNLHQTVAIGVWPVSRVIGSTTRGRPYPILLSSLEKPESLRSQ